MGRRLIPVGIRSAKGRVVSAGSSLSAAATAAATDGFVGVRQTPTTAPDVLIRAAVIAAMPSIGRRRFPQVLADDEGGLRRETRRTASAEIEAKIDQLLAVG